MTKYGEFEYICISKNPPFVYPAFSELMLHNLHNL
jgi:hypothetical protein